MLGISAIIVGAGHILAGLIGIIFYVLPQHNHITIIGIFVLMVAVVVLSIGFGLVVKHGKKNKNHWLNPRQQNYDTNHVSC